MGYGQTWLFNYPSPTTDTCTSPVVHREYSRQPSTYDDDDSPDEAMSAPQTHRGRDVAAFSLTPIEQTK